MVVIPNRVRVVLVVSALALAAGLLTLALLGKPAQAQAETFTDTTRETDSGIIGSCAVDPVFVEGTFHFVSHTTIDANGGFHTKVQATIQGQGEGLRSGDKYVFHQVAIFHVNSTGASNQTFTETVKIIRQGSDTTTDDFNSRFVFHVTVDANGEVTTNFVKFEDEVCT
jgi:ABC-type phosphate transport system substrate-binding protein